MNWKQILKKYQKESNDIQHANKEIILKAFQVCLDKSKDEKEFAKYTTGIVFFPEMLYFIYKRG